MHFKRINRRWKQKRIEQRKKWENNYCAHCTYTAMTNILTVNVYNSCFFLSLVIFFFFLLLLYSNFRSNCLNFHSNLWAQWNLRSNSKRCLCECGVVCKIRNYVELNSGINFILSYNTLHMFNINFWWILMKNVISNSVTSMSVCVCVYLHKSNFITILLVIIPPKKK